MQPFSSNTKPSPPDSARMRSRCETRGALQGIVLVKNMWRKKEGEAKGSEVQRSKLVAELERLITENGSRSALLTKQKQV